MKISITTIAVSALLAGSVLTSVASAGSLTAEREARTLRIEALTQDVASGRLNRSQRILAKFKLLVLRRREENYAVLPIARETSKQH